MIHRRFNQSALLAHAIAKNTGATCAPDALIRLRNTAPQEGLTVQERFKLQAGAIAANPKRLAALKGASILLVDDVMTSGATLASAAGALNDAGAAQVNTVTLARVVKGF